MYRFQLGGLLSNDLEQSVASDLFDSVEAYYDPGPATATYQTVQLQKEYKVFSTVQSKTTHKITCFLQATYQMYVPRYTIMIPLFRELSVIKHLLHQIERIRYDRRKLEVLLVIEEKDPEMRCFLQNTILPDHYKIVTVPATSPQTKAKACNYALRFVTGDYVTIFDAEDAPDQNQLLKALRLFLANDHIDCLQGQLNYYNYSENLLTRMFSVEYAIHFELILPVLVNWNIPVPLGGSSNHIKTNLLRKLGGWDSYNVTEDADLGLRIYKNYNKLHNTFVIPSQTLEESPTDILSWIQQRTRWMKGHIQTFLIYFKKQKAQEKSITNAMKLFCLANLLFVPTISLMLAPFSFCVTIISLFGIQQFNSTAWTVAHITSYSILGIWYICAVVQGYVVARLNRLRWGIAMQHSCFILPFYFFLHICGAYCAVYQYMTKPFHWNKTTHGLSKWFLKNGTGSSHIKVSL